MNRKPTVVRQKLGDAVHDGNLSRVRPWLIPGMPHVAVDLSDQKDIDLPPPWRQ